MRQWTLNEICTELSLPVTTVKNWRDAFDWDSQCVPTTAEMAITKRICVLSDRDKKTKAECEELSRLITDLGELQIRQAKAQKIRKEGVSSKAAHADAEGKEKKRSRTRNDISKLTAEIFQELREKLFYGYQKLWHKQKGIRHRFILKSRQIGATFYFAFEAFEDAVLTGDNQLFLSASRDQAEVFKAYIIAFAKQYFDLELKGAGFILLSNGAELRFLSTNMTTAQSYHGHLYTDEVFWMLNYEKIAKVSSGMAAHKKWRKTTFSTPSAQSHGAYKVWSGEKYNSTLPEKKRVQFDISHEALKDGDIFPDGIWRHMVTVQDAEDQGCDLFDINELKTEYSKDEFDNLFMCKFIDDSQSVFNLAMLMLCAVELESWPDYNENLARPYGNKPVAIGYDPSRTVDLATKAVLSLPKDDSDYFKLLKRDSYKNQGFEYQANRIKEDLESHNVQHIGIDTTGMGTGVFELVEQFYPLATAINYSNDAKNRLVMKALDVIEKKRFRYLSADTEVTRSFLMITRTTSGSGMIIYGSARNKESGHADIAWAIMHGMAYEPLISIAQTTVSM